ncbi:MAG: diphosphate--fructose-6-phosphate 1-phosphotransferase [Clostridia bacterium]|nr:diphosphate--fructose-6-phosphate 1-phosphotransferase [Clostridia bacterium]MDY5555573.1 diphosphate--fructose-6-phosphate 1-phosphotransferase [Blautia sp.]
MSQNVLVVHGGGPTAVINASLYGVIEEAKRNPEVGKVYGAIGGTGAIFSETFLDLTSFEDDKLKLLLHTPASAIGSSRYPLYEKDYEKMAEIFRKYDIKYVLLNGGNGTMDACGHIYEVCRNLDIRVVGIPKTIDNDIAMTDHCPGYGSAARYIAASAQEVGEDIKSLPIHVCIMEAMGRNAGWITAASALARRKQGDAPHLIYLPERNFNETEFLEDVSRLYEKQGGVLVVVSEGLHNANGESIVPPIFKTERAVYYGDVSSHLANLVVKELGIKARSEKPGLCGRASVALQSPVDREEARMAGIQALRSAVEGKSGVMIGFERIPGDIYQIQPKLVPIKEVMLYERKMPDTYINERGNDVTEEFINWCKPLIGGDLPEFLNFRDYI